LAFTVEPQIIKGCLLTRVEALAVVRAEGGEQLTHFATEPLATS
jgi:hypothetical protein